MASPVKHQSPDWNAVKRTQASSMDDIHFEDIQTGIVCTEGPDGKLTVERTTEKAAYIGGATAIGVKSISTVIHPPTIPSKTVKKISSEKKEKSPVEEPTSTAQKGLKKAPDHLVSFLDRARELQKKTLQQRQLHEDDMVIDQVLINGVSHSKNTKGEWVEVSEDTAYGATLPTIQNPTQTLDDVVAKIRREGQNINAERYLCAGGIFKLTKDKIICLKVPPNVINNGKTEWSKS